jgi:hypothetical protein
MMRAKGFNITPGPVLAKDLARAIREAAGAGDVLVIDPGRYTLDAPVHVEFTSHHTEPWGVWAFGATFSAAFDDEAPLVLLEATGSAQCRCMSIDGLGLRGSRTQPGLKLMSKATGAAIYRFALNRLAVQGCDDAIVLEGNVFEGDIVQPWCSDGNNGLAFGNPAEGGIISAINIFGGSLSQNFVDGVRTYSAVEYREPYDFSMFGTYLGNNGRYSINAAAGITLLKGVRVENPWSDPATHDPENRIERACIKLANFGTLEQVTGGGNGNATTLVDAYLSGNPLTMRECSIYNDRGLPVKLAKLDGNEGKAVFHAYGCRQRIEYTDKVRVTYEAP